MYVGLKQPRGDGERYVTPARAAANETRSPPASLSILRPGQLKMVILKIIKHFRSAVA